MNKELIQELRGSALMMIAAGQTEYAALLKQAAEEGNEAARQTQPKAASFPDAEVSDTGFAIQHHVLILPVTGMMTKYSTWLLPGMDLLAKAIQQAETDDSIVGTVLLMNTYGGTVQSWLRMEEVLRSRKKPCVAVVDGLCASAGMYVAVLCDRIYAVNPTCKVGSIGVMAQLIDDSKQLKQYGLKLIEVYPPESNWKNRPEREALEGKTDLLISENLSPLARHFRQVVREMRPDLDESVEGVLAGRMFYAEDALKAGLIDGITTLNDAIAQTADLAADRKAIINSIV